MPNASVGLTLLQHWRLDCFKLGTAFELALKARILRSGFLLHLVSPSKKALAAVQRNTPREWGLA